MLDTIALLVALALLMAGVAMTVYDDLTKKHKVAVIVVFLVLGIAATWVNREQSKRAEVAGVELNDAIRNLSDSSAEQARLTRQNAELQQEAIDLSRENRALAGDLLQRSVGDPDNPPYVWFFDFDFSKDVPASQPYVVNSSRQFPAREVAISGSLSGEFLTSAAHTLPPTQEGLIARAPLDMPNRRGFDIRSFTFSVLENVGSISVSTFVITSLAGSYLQQVVLIRVSDSEIQQGSRVFRNEDRDAPIFVKYDPNFPEDFKWPDL